MLYRCGVGTIEENHITIYAELYYGECRPTNIIQTAFGFRHSLTRIFEHNEDLTITGRQDNDNL